jgi:hypothetical protein
MSPREDLHRWVVILTESKDWKPSDFSPRPSADTIGQQRWATAKKWNCFEKTRFLHSAPTAVPELPRLRFPYSTFLNELARGVDGWLWLPAVAIEAVG